jgi:hypothetical protein
VLCEEPEWLLDQLREQLLRGGSVVASRHPAVLQNDEGPANADPSTEDGRYWARTSDPQLVELVLSQLS